MITDDGDLRGYTTKEGEFMPSVIAVIKMVCKANNATANHEWQRIKDVANDKNAKYNEECSSIVQGSRNTEMHHTV